MKELWKRITHPFTPASLIVFTHAISDKEQISANFYIKSVEEIHRLGDHVRVLFDNAEADFKQKLREAQAEAEKAAKKGQK